MVGVAWYSPEGDEDSDVHWVLFTKYEVWCKDVQCHGYKNDEYEEFCVSTITFSARRGNNLWSGDNKRYAANIRFGYTTTYPEGADESGTIVISNPSSTYVSYSNAWGIFYPYSIWGHYTLEAFFTMQKYQSGLWITKACAISFAQFYVN